MPVERPECVEQVDEVFGAHVARRSRRERTAAEAADARIESPDAGVEPRRRVGQRETAGVVEMEAEFDVVADLCSYGGDDRRDVVGGRAADRVGQHDLECARRRDPLRNPGDGLDRHLALEGAAERGRQVDAHRQPGGPSDLR